jgi:hypothetical protein
MRLGDDLLATPEGVARGWGVGEATPCLARSSRRGRPDRLGACLTRFGFHPRQKGGAKTGANPTDKGKKGTKRHLISDRRGIPLAVVLTAANVHDSMVFEELIDAVEPIKRPGRGRPRKRPEKVHADKAYDDKKCKGALERQRERQSALCTSEVRCGSLREDRLHPQKQQRGLRCSEDTLRAEYARSKMRQEARSSSDARGRLVRVRRT